MVVKLRLNQMAVKLRLNQMAVKLRLNQMTVKLRLNERKSEQAHIPQAPTLLENAVYNEWQFQALASGNRTKKGYKLLLKGIKSAFPVKMHIYTLFPS